MAEIKWSNVNGDSMNSAVSNVLSATDSFARGLNGLATTVGSGIDDIQKRRDEALKWQREQNTESIVNQMLNADSLESLKQMQAEGIGSAQSAMSQFNGQVDLSRLNQAKASWVSDAQNRAVAKDDLKDYTDAAIKYKQGIEQALATGDVARAQAMIANGTGVLSQKSMQALSKTLMEEAYQQKAFNEKVREFDLSSAQQYADLIERTRSNQANESIHRQNIALAKLQFEQSLVDATAKNKALSQEESEKLAKMLNDSINDYASLTDAQKTAHNTLLEALKDTSENANKNLKDAFAKAKALGLFSASSDISEDKIQESILALSTVKEGLLLNKDLSKKLDKIPDEVITKSSSNNSNSSEEGLSPAEQVMRNAQVFINSDTGTNVKNTNGNLKVNTKGNIKTNVTQETKITPNTTAPITPTTNESKTANKEDAEQAKQQLIQQQQITQNPSEAIKQKVKQTEEISKEPVSTKVEDGKVQPAEVSSEQEIKIPDTFSNEELPWNKGNIHRARLNGKQSVNLPAEYATQITKGNIPKGDTVTYDAKNNEIVVKQLPNSIYSVKTTNGGNHSITTREQGTVTDVNTGKTIGASKDGTIVITASGTEFKNSLKQSDPLLSKQYKTAKELAKAARKESTAQLSPAHRETLNGYISPALKSYSGLQESLQKVNNAIAKETSPENKEFLKSIRTQLDSLAQSYNNASATGQYKDDGKGGKVEKNPYEVGSEHFDRAVFEQAALDRTNRLNELLPKDIRGSLVASSLNTSTENLIHSGVNGNSLNVRVPDEDGNMKGHNLKIDNDTTVSKVVTDYLNFTKDGTGPFGDGKRILDEARKWDELGHSSPEHIAVFMRNVEAMYEKAKSNDLNGELIGRDVIDPFHKNMEALRLLSNKDFNNLILMEEKVQQNSAELQTNPLLRMKYAQDYAQSSAEDRRSIPASDRLHKLSGVSAFDSENVLTNPAYKQIRTGIEASVKTVGDYIAKNPAKLRGTTFVRTNVGNGRIEDREVFSDDWKIPVEVLAEIPRLQAAKANGLLTKAENDMLTGALSWMETQKEKMDKRFNVDRNTFNASYPSEKEREFYELYQADLLKRKSK